MLARISDFKVESHILWTGSQILRFISVHFNVLHSRNPKLKSLNSMPAVILIL